MSARTGISWCDSTKNLWSGCTPVSPGCAHCYAERDSKRYGYDFSQLHRHSTRNAAELCKWNDLPFYECQGCGARYAPTNEQNELKTCAYCLEPDVVVNDVRRRVFINSQSDFFDNRVPQEWRDEAYAIFERCPNLDIILLTKRIGNVRKMVPQRWLESWPKHVRIGATFCNQEELERDLYKLLDLPAPVRFISFGPLLSDISFEGLFANPDGVRVNGAVYFDATNALEQIQWVIVEGESGPGARPMHPDWVRSIRDQCITCEVPFHFKQWGEWMPVDGPLVGTAFGFHGRPEGFENGWIELDGSTTPYSDHRNRSAYTTYIVGKVGKKAAGRLLDGREWNGFPRAA
jgi:protein gp37